MTCKTCRFWEDKDFRLQPNGNKSPDDSRNQDGGLCHQRSPVPMNGWRAFPTTLESDWCGKWQQGKTETVPNEEAFVATVTAVNPTPPYIKDYIADQKAVLARFDKPTPSALPPAEAAPCTLPSSEPIVAEGKPSFLESFKKRGRPKKVVDTK